MHLRVGWEAYQALLAWRGERAVPRLAYRDGVLELIRPSMEHERIANTIARLVEIWALVRGVELTGLKSWTLRSDEAQRGVEPDECYVIGGARVERPDLAIEVVRSHSAMDKLAIYAALGVPEVWEWRGGRLAVLVLEGGNYLPSTGSRVLPGIPVDRISRLAMDPDQASAAPRFYAELHA